MNNPAFNKICEKVSSKIADLDYRIESQPNNKSLKDKRNAMKELKIFLEGIKENASDPEHLSIPDIDSITKKCEEVSEKVKQHSDVNEILMQIISILSNWGFEVQTDSQKLVNEIKETIRPKKY